LGRKNGIRSGFSKDLTYINTNWGGRRHTNIFKKLFYDKTPYWGPKGPQKPALVFDLRIKGKEMKQYMATKFKGMDYIPTLRNIKRAMDKAKVDVVKGASKFIMKYVPKDTGVLRKTMIGSLGTSNVLGTKLTMILDTGNLDYAKPVNNMPTSMLAHNMKQKRHSSGWLNQNGKFVKNRVHPGWGMLLKNSTDVHNKKRAEISNEDKYLHDPDAKKGWWGFSVMNTRKVARKAYDKFIDDVILLLTVPIYKSAGMKPPIKTGLGYKELKERLAAPSFTDFWSMEKCMKHFAFIKAHSSKESMIEFYTQMSGQINKILKFRYIKKYGQKQGLKKWANMSTETRRRLLTTVFNRKYERTGKGGRLNEYYFPDLAYEFPYLWQSFRDDAPIPYQFTKDFTETAEARSRIERQSRKNADQDELLDQKIISRNIRLRGWASRHQLISVITPTRLEIKRLFKVRFK